MNIVTKIGGNILIAVGGIFALACFAVYDSTKEGTLLIAIIMFLVLSAPLLGGGFYLIRKSKLLLEKKIKDEREKLEKELKADFPNHWEYIMNGQLVQGMTFDMVTCILGASDDRKESVSKDKKIEKYKYKPYRNRQNNISFKIEVTFENGLVTGWKEL